MSAVILERKVKYMSAEIGLNLLAPATAMPLLGAVLCTPHSACSPRRTCSTSLPSGNLLVDVWFVPWSRNIAKRKRGIFRVSWSRWLSTVFAWAQLSLRLFLSPFRVLCQANRPLSPPPFLFSNLSEAPYSKLTTETNRYIFFRLRRMNV